MKTALKIIWIIVATCVLVVLIVVLTDDDKAKEITPLNQISESDRLYSDSIVNAMAIVKDSLNAIKSKELAEKKEMAEKRLKSFRSRTDEFESVTFFKHSQTPKYTNSNFIYPYIGNDGNSYWLRLTFQYAADSWLFIERVKIKTDTEQYDIATSFKRDNHTEIWEWADIKANQTEYLMLRDMASSKDVLIRYEGRQYYKDRKLTAKEKNVITETLDVFEAIDTN